MNKNKHLLPPYVNGNFVSLAKPERIFTQWNPLQPASRLVETGWSRELSEPIAEGMLRSQRLFAHQDFKTRLFQVQSLIANLIENADEVLGHLSVELARSRVAVCEEWKLCLSLFSILPHFCEESLKERHDGDGYWAYAPVGRVLISTNVSLPFYSLLSASLPALIAGNAVCLHVPISCALSASLIAEAAHKSGLPSGLLQVVYGDIEVFRRMISANQFDTILYTGGEESLEQLRRDVSVHQGTRAVLSSGGKNVSLVLPTADINASVLHTVHGACVDTGQRIESTGIVFVDKKVISQFVELTLKTIKNFPIGVRNELSNPNDLVMGPLCNQTSWERFLRFQGIAARESDETLRWGKPIDNPGNGFYVSPGLHLMSPTKALTSVYASNAFFGPSLIIVPVDSADEAIDVVDKLGVSRAMAVHTSYEEEVRYVRNKSDVPTLIWNNSTTLLDPNLPTIGRGRAGNSYVTGVRFLFSTVFPKSLNLGAALVSLLFCLFLKPQSAQAEYRKAVESNEVVKGKLYPRSGKFEINPLQVGGVLNQSFVTTFLGVFGVGYHFNEWHAVSGEFMLGLSSDKEERTCLENFYLKPNAATAAGAPGQCDVTDSTDPAGGPKDTEGNAAFKRKPAYLAVRQLDQMVGINYQWTPVYGKQIYFLSYVGHLDLFLNTGLGAGFSTYSPQRTITASGSDISANGTSVAGEYGKAGRPEAQKQISPVFNIGVGNRFYFAKSFLINIEMRNYTLFGSDGNSGSDWMNFVAIWGGLGILF